MPISSRRTRGLEAIGQEMIAGLKRVLDDVVDPQTGQFRRQLAAFVDDKGSLDQAFQKYGNKLNEVMRSGLETGVVTPAMAKMKAMLATRPASIQPSAMARKR